MQVAVNVQQLGRRIFGALLTIAVMVSALAPTSISAAQADLATARELYLGASYEEALKALDSLPPDAAAAAATDVALYRVLCLLALQRSDEATAIIQEMVAENPYYHLSDAQASPRVQGVFDDVRRAALPGLVQRRYAAARAAFDKNDPRSLEQFERLLTLLDDPDLKAVTSADFRVLVAGFRDLSRALAAPPEAPRPAADSPSTAPERPLPVQSAASAAAASDRRPAQAPTPVVVKPPVALYQPMPRWTPANLDVGKVFTGRLEILIDEQGKVTSAVLDAPVYPSFDEELLRMAKTWKFRPATRSGVPITYVKGVQIQLQRNR